MGIIDYETIGADDLSNLDHEVNVAIKDGWQPLGSIAVSSCVDVQDVYHTYVQAMVRYTSDE